MRHKETKKLTTGMARQRASGAGKRGAAEATEARRMCVYLMHVCLMRVSDADLRDYTAADVDVDVGVDVGADVGVDVAVDAAVRCDRRCDRRRGRGLTWWCGIAKYASPNVARRPPSKRRVQEAMQQASRRKPHTGTTPAPPRHMRAAQWPVDASMGSAALLHKAQGTRANAQRLTPCCFCRLAQPTAAMPLTA